MNRVPQIEPISRVTKDHKSVFARLESGPVILANRSQPQAVLISIDELERRRACRRCGWLTNPTKQKIF